MGLLRLLSSRCSRCKTRRRWKPVALLLFLTVVRNEFVVYWWSTLYWPSVPHCASSTNNVLDCPLNLMIVSDPQILGPKSEPLAQIFGYFDTDPYLTKSFRTALHHIKPDCIIFLGDLMDEGSTSTDAEYDQYKARFDRIFNVEPYKPKVIYLPGDNDIGGEGSDYVTQAKLDRFKRHFPSPEETIVRHLDLISVNRILGDLNLIHEQWGAAIDTNPNNKSSSFRAILSHIPLTFINGIFSREVLTRLKPQMILSAHDHRLAAATTRLDDDTFVIEEPFHDLRGGLKKRLNDLECLEVMFPTCSYRMGVPRTGYGFIAIATDGDIQVSVLWNHSRFWSLWIYVAVLVVSLIVLLLF